MIFRGTAQLAKGWLVDRLLSYERSDLVAALRRLGVVDGDTLMVHSAWRVRNGFRGKPVDVIAALKDAVGQSGLLVMPSLTYQNESSAQFLARGVPMNARRDPSQMGLLTEVFRRGRGVVRSLSPTHPLLAWGRGAEAFVAGHENAVEPFGTGSPFERLLDRDAAILGFDAPFSTFTFTHFLESRIAPRLPFAFWEAEPMIGTVVDGDGQQIECRVRVIRAEANDLRREERLVAGLIRGGLLQSARIGNTSLLMIRTRAMIDCAQRMLDAGETFFDAPSR